MHPHPVLSIVVPLYKKEASVRPLHVAIVAAALGVPFEILFVHDCSRDATPRIARELARTDPRVCVVCFRRNYDQTPPWRQA